jgi:hypothetical protein
MIPWLVLSLHEYVNTCMEVMKVYEEHDYCRVGTKIV